MSQTIRTIKSWLEEFVLAEHKTELVLLTNWRKRKTVQICISEHIIRPQPSPGSNFELEAELQTILKVYWEENSYPQFNISKDASKYKRPETQ